MFTKCMKLKKTPTYINPKIVTATSINVYSILSIGTQSNINVAIIIKNDNISKLFEVK